VIRQRHPGETHEHPGPPRFLRWPAAALATSLVLVGCGDESEDPVVGGAAASDVTVSEDLEINSLLLELPEDGVHEEGEDVTLYAAITNTGTTAQRLVDVEGDDFADARLVALDGGEGAIEVAPDDNVYLEPEGPPSVVLLDLARSLRSSESVEVTFVFEDAGQVTVEAPVAADPPGQGDFEAPEDPTEDN
jgi:copper(I)-binding protein